MKLEGKVAIVTGGGQGIGQGIVLCLAEEGADVAIVDINRDTATKVAAEVKTLGRKSLAIVADATDNKQVTQAVQETIDTFGKIDILVNNVGGLTKTRLARTSLEFIDQEEADKSELSPGSELSLAEPEDRAGDFKEILARYGLDLIVEKIETEDDVLDVMRINVDYGQGSLFGAPQPVGASETVDSLLPSPEPDQRHEARGRQSLDKTGIA